MKHKLFATLGFSVCMLAAQAQTWTVYNKSNSPISGNGAFTVAIDSANNKWVGTNATIALDEFTGTGWKRDSDKYITSGSLGSDIAFTSTGNLWIGSVASGLSMFNGTTWTNYTTSNSSLPYNIVYAVAVDSANNIWVGTKGNGIAKFDGVSNWTLYNTSNSGLLDDDIYSLAIDKSGNVWVGTEYTGVEKFDGTNWTSFTAANSGLPGDNIYGLVFDPNGNLWAGTSSGIAVYNGTSWKAYTTANSGLPDNYVGSFAFSPGVTWVATRGKGLARFDGNTWMIYDSTNSGIGSNELWTIAMEKNQQNIWIATDGNGLSHMDITGVVFNCSLDAKFTYTTGTGGTATFTSTSTGTKGKNTYYNWDAGDNHGTSTDSIFSYTYTYNGTYAVNLRISDSAGGCVADTFMYVTITTGAGCNLHANFTYTTGANGLVNFTNTSTGVASGAKYYWSAGDSYGYGNGSSYSYNYNYNGTYAVSLYVSDSIGVCSSDTTIYVTVTNAGVCGLGANFTYVTGANGEVTFTSTSTGMNSSTQLYWYAGDNIGYGYGNPYSYTYAANGTYPVNLFLYNTNGGCVSDTTINVTITNANNSISTCTLGMLLTAAKASCDTCNDGTAVIAATGGTSPYTYNWSNGATTSTIMAKPGIYTCCVTDAKGCSACASATVTDSCLFAEFTYNITYDTTGSADSAVIVFTSISDTVCADSSLYKGAQKNPKITYTWSFGDGNSQTISGIGIKTSKHTFKPGNYDITLAINREGSPTKSVTTKPVKIKHTGTLTQVVSVSGAADMKLYPNPNNGTFTIDNEQLKTGNETAQVTIYDLLGREVTPQLLNVRFPLSIDMSNQASGTYFVRVTTAGKVYNSKVVIQK